MKRISAGGAVALCCLAVLLTSCAATRTPEALIAGLARSPNFSPRLLAYDPDRAQAIVEMIAREGSGRTSHCERFWFDERAGDWTGGEQYVPIPEADAKEIAETARQKAWIPPGWVIFRTEYDALFGGFESPGHVNTNRVFVYADDPSRSHSMWMGCEKVAPGGWRCIGTERWAGAVTLIGRGNREIPFAVADPLIAFVKASRAVAMGASAIVDSIAWVSPADDCFKAINWRPTPSLTEYVVRIHIPAGPPTPFITREVDLRMADGKPEILAIDTYTMKEDFTRHRAKSLVGTLAFLISEKHPKALEIAGRLPKYESADILTVLSDLRRFLEWEMCDRFDGKPPPPFPWSPLGAARKPLPDDACDSWGTPFRVEMLAGDAIRFTSAGPDRIFGSTDDMNRTWPLAPAR